nr:chemotaxis protein CheW [uncultured Sphingomonas sp.]
MSRQLITFQLDQQFLAVDIMAIREIRAWTPAMPLPNAASHVLGVINLRGTVLPVLDLRLRLGWGATETTARHVIIVVQAGDQLQGLVVDAVNDIVTFDEEALQAVPQLSEDLPSNFLEGLASAEDRMIMVLSLGRLLEQPAVPDHSSEGAEVERPLAEHDAA